MLKKMFLSYWLAILCLPHTHLQYTRNNACFMSDLIWKDLEESHFCLIAGQQNFVAYEPFMWLRIDEILQCIYFNESLLCTKIISSEGNNTGDLETAISVLM